MSITASNLTSGSSTSVQSSYTTNSITPSANKLVLVTVNSHTSSGTPNTPTVTGASMTWVQINTVTSGSDRITSFRGMSASPGSGTLTIDFSAQNQHDINYSIDQFSNVDTSGTNGSGAIVQSVTNTGTSTSGSVTLSALQNGLNAAFGGIEAAAGGVTISSGSGFTSLVNLQNSSTGLGTEYQINKTSVNWTWTGGSALFLCIGIEVKALISGGSFLFNFL